MIRKCVFAAMAIELSLLGNAMPTDREINQARPVVESLVADDLNALKLKTKRPVAVVMSLLSMIDKAETEGEKFLLLKSAFALSARNEQYDLAAKTLERLKREITDLPPDMIVTMVDKEMKRVDPKKAPGVSVIYKEAYHRVMGLKRLAEVKAELKKKPNDKALMRNVADCYVSIGNWPKALQAYSRLGVEAAKYELDPDSSAGYDALKAADYWWGYKAADDKPFKVHAAGLYNVAVEKGLAAGLRREMALKRIEDSKQLGVLRAQSREPVMGGMGNPVVTRIAKKTKPAALDVGFKAGLVGYWPFDGDANDASGARNSGKPMGVVPTEDRFGESQKAYRFNGSSYVEVPDTLSLRNITGAVTMMAWINPRGWYNGQIPIMQKGNKRDVQYQFEVERGKALWQAGKLMGQMNLEIGKWQHIALTFNGTETIFYYNGQKRHMWGSRKRLTQNPGALFIGYDPWGMDEYFIGDMDDVRLYNRALSEKEIQELYKAESPEE